MSDEIDHDEPEMSTAERLRAFEDEIFGEHHTRHAGQIEKGHGSPFGAADQKHRDHHAALEALIEAEKEHQAVSTAEANAHAKLEAAIKRVADTEEAL